MERVTFLLEDTGERLGCLLNPENVVQRRTAGLVTRSAIGGRLGGNGLSDDPLLFTGGGRTELDLSLLFDVTIAGSTIATDDVRDLTEPLWRLAESPAADERGGPRTVRFVWGKVWNVPGVVVSVAEQLEDFTPGGSPRRSWLALRLRRTAAPPRRTTTAVLPGQDAYVPDQLLPAPPEAVRVHQSVGSTPELPGSSERLETLAARYYGDAGMWRLIAKFNGIADPTAVPPGTPLRIPPLSVLGRPA